MKNFTTSGLTSSRIGCTEDNIDYYGFDLSQEMAESALACRILCQQNSDCNFWTWIKPTYNGVHGPGIRLKCFLKSSEAGKEAMDGVMSGTKLCQTGTNFHFFSIYTLRFIMVLRKFMLFIFDLIFKKSRAVLVVPCFN